MNIKISFTITIIFLTGQFSFGQTDSLVEKIIEVDIVNHEYSGAGGFFSEQYMRYSQLSRSRTIDELVDLTKHTNLTVRCYAAWCLIDKDYKDLDKIFIEFLTEDKKVTTRSGSIQSSDPISSVLYHRYWNNAKDQKTDKMLLRLDSITLYYPKSYWLLTSRAFGNRVYEKTYHPQIQYLAFKKLNNDALIYLSNWYKAEYKDQLKEALVKYLKKTKFSKTGTTGYYNMVSHILAFQDKYLEKIVVKKLKKDKHWKHDKEQFLGLLRDYYIYESDIE